MTTSKLFRFIDDNIDVTSAVRRQIKAAIEVRKVKAGEAFFCRGVPAVELGFIEDGFFKVHGANAHGKPFVVEFAGPGEFLADYAAHIARGPCTIDCVALEKSEVSCISFEAYERFADELPSVQKIARGVLEGLVLKLATRELSLLTMSATERYAAFAAERPALLSRLSRADLAQYLGVEPQSLTRIRSALAKARRQAAAAKGR